MTRRNDTPAGYNHLRLRLSQLIARAEEISELPLRTGERGELLLGPYGASKVLVAVGAPGARPGYFAAPSITRKSVSGLWAYYGIERTQSGRWMKHGFTAGWLLPGEMRTRGRARRGA